MRIQHLTPVYPARMRSWGRLWRPYFQKGCIFCCYELLQFLLAGETNLLKTDAFFGFFVGSQRFRFMRPWQPDFCICCCYEQFFATNDCKNWWQFLMFTYMHICLHICIYATNVRIFVSVLLLWMSCCYTRVMVCSSVGLRSLCHPVTPCYKK